MTVTNFPGGLTSFGVPLIGSGSQIPVSTGTYFFVDSSTGSNSNSGLDKDHPFATVDYAVGRCTASKGDVIIVMPAHAETLTAAVTCDVIGVSIVGLGYGRLRPALTTSGAIDGITITAANVTLKNLRVVGAASATALVNIAAADATIENCVFEHGAAPLMAITYASGARAHILNNYFYGTADGPDAVVDFEASGITDWVFRGNLCNYGPNGIDLAILRANIDTTTGGICDSNVMLGIDLTAIDFNSSSAAQGDGIISNNVIGAASSVANIDTMIDAGGYLSVNNYGTDLPAEGGGLVPVTTPA